MLDDHGIIQYESPAVERVLGFRPDELVGRHVVELVHPDDVPVMAEAFNRAVPEPGVRVTTELRVQHKDGSWRVLEAIGKAVSDEQGRPGGVINSRDITERRQAQAQMQQHLAELEAVNHLSRSLRAAETLDQMLPTLRDEALHLLGTDTAAVWLYDEGRAELRQMVASGWLQATAATPLRLSAHSGLGQKVFASGQPYISSEFASDPGTREAIRPLISPGWGGALVPIRSTQRILGVLHVAVALPRTVLPHEVRLLSTLCEIAGNALQRTALHEQTVRRLQQLYALSQVDQSITSATDLRVTLFVVLDQAVTQLGVSAADVLLFNPAAQRLECARGRGFRAPLLEKAAYRLSETPAGQAVTERRLVRLTNLAEGLDWPQWRQVAAQEGFETYYGVPLIAKSQVMGVLEVMHRGPLDPDDDWLHFLQSLGEQTAIAIENSLLFDGLQRSHAELFQAYDATIEGWSRALDLRDRETEGHTQRVTALAVRLAEAIGLPSADLVHLRRGALLHDIGKLGVPDRILHKPGPLSDEEWTAMRQHPVLAFELLSPIAYLKPALDIPYCHHEKWDGTGYPRGLKGETIPLSARIFAVVDVWDALRSDRPYRGAWPETKVRDHIQALAGTHIDPAVVAAFLRLELGARQ